MEAESSAVSQTGRSRLFITPETDMSGCDALMASSHRERARLKRGLQVCESRVAAQVFVILAAEKSPPVTLQLLNIYETY